MVNPRQRSKRRSGSHKPVQHSKHAKKMLKKPPPIRGPKILQDAWDRHKTVKQNYDALGLASSLNPTSSGGTERELRDPQSRISSNMEPYVSGAQPSGDHIPKGHGRIIRDEDGNVVGIEVPEDETPQGDRDKEIYDLDHDIVSVDDSTIGWVQLGSSRRMPRLDNRSEVVQVLAKLSEDVRSRDPRFLSVGEKSYLERLVAKHKDDYEAMARDRKANPEQRTAGELARAIRRAGDPAYGA